MFVLFNISIGLKPGTIMVSSSSTQDVNGGLAADGMVLAYSKCSTGLSLPASTIIFGIKEIGDYFIKVSDVMNQLRLELSEPD